MRFSPRAGCGTPGQVSVNSAESRNRLQGTGVSASPAADPPANVRRSRRVNPITSSFVAGQATVGRAAPAMAVLAGIHILKVRRTAVAADAIHSRRTQSIAPALRAMALHAIHMRQFGVSRVREMNILRLARIHL